MKATNAKLQEKLLELEDKYYQLVWYARKSFEDFSIPGVEAAAKSVEFLFENETNDLNGKDGDWYHGFNSGVLAGVRFALTAKEYGIEQAEFDFPELDT